MSEPGDNPSAEPEDILDLELDDEEALPPVLPAAEPAGDVLVLDDLSVDLPANLPPSPLPKGRGSTEGLFPTADLSGEAHAKGKGGKGAPMGKPSVTVQDVVAILNTMLAGAIGGGLAWVFANPFIVDPVAGAPPQVQLLGVQLAGMGLFFACAGGMIGMMLGAVEGINSRSWEKAARGGFFGLTIGAGGGFIGGVIGQAVYGGFGGGNQAMPGPLQVLLRGIGWALVGLCVGLAQGALVRSRRKMINGLVGGLLGGAAGGLLFDPIHVAIAQAMRLTGGTVGGGASRLVALVVVGLACGAAIGAIEQARKEAWLRIVEGPLTGKQFILYRSPTLIGSSSQCEITLALDKSVAPQHAAITEVGGRHTIADLETSTGTRVNGQAVRTRALQSGDRIGIGQTVMLYRDRVVGE
jgi:hypothetical protein